MIKLTSTRTHIFFYLHKNQYVLKYRKNNLSFLYIIKIIINNSRVVRRLKIAEKKHLFYINCICLYVQILI